MSAEKKNLASKDASAFPITDVAGKAKIKNNATRIFSSPDPSRYSYIEASTTVHNTTHKSHTAIQIIAKNNFPICES